ncbi:MAG: right-handed parallel beta-helix repeat-containing protein [Lewinellaceae bacterium]|nr:right-handed parallel beta-helix repeat-containing protein [Saprospiraceae bacterium]MCB9339069.1 right-handed parallel beta-helix repeat-containing protein [Lewinellaceae bacterium]
MKNSLLPLLASILLQSFQMSAQANYFVATTGSNANPGTSVGLPWQTIQYALDHVSAGAVIQVRGGIYHEKINWSASGTAAMPVVLTNYLDEEPIVSGNGIPGQTAIIHIENKSHLRIENLVLEDNYMAEAKGIYVVGQGEDITIEGCTIRNIGFTTNPATNPNPVNGQAHGILVNGRTTVGYKDIFIKKNELHNLITGNSESLTLVGNVFNFEIDNNSLHNNTNIGIDIAGHYSWAVDAGVPALLNQARNGTVTRNIVYEHRRFSNLDAPAGIYADGSKDVVIEHNFVFRNGNGLSVGCENTGKTAENIVVKNNFVFDNDNNGIFFGANTGDIVNCHLRNNTFLKNGMLEIYTMEIFLQKSTGCLIANNILYARTISHYGIGLFGYTAVNLDIDYNLVFREGGDLSELITGDPAPPANTNTVAANPLLVNAGLPSPDFHLQPTSPAINQGNNSYVSANEKELDQGTRIVGPAVDKGADESGSQGCATSFVLNGIVPAGIFQATSSATSNGAIEAGSSVTIRAPEILLQPGFQVIAGGLFSAEVSGCAVLP